MKTFALKKWIVGITCCLIVAGCGSKEPETVIQEKAVEQIIERGLAQEGKTADVNINQDNDSLSITVKDEKDGQTTTTMNTTEDGMQMNIDGPDSTIKMQSGPQAKIPEAFPADVPLYPDIKLQMVVQNENQGFTLSGTLSDDMNTVAEFFKKSCVEQGWEEVMVMAQSSEMHMLNYKKEGRVLSIMLALANGEVGVNITTGQE